MDKLAPVPVDLSKLSYVIKNDVVKKAVYDKLAAKVNNIDTSAFASKTKYQTKQNQKRKFLMRLTLLRKQNSLNQRMKFQMLVDYQQKLH